MIKFIDNQSVKFVKEGEYNTCGCVGKHYCQPVRFTDETQFQILGNVLNTDPGFSDIYIGWETWTAVLLSTTSIGVSSVGVCDGSISAVASAGSGGFQYKKDSGAFQASGSFTGLCEGTYLITVIDSAGNYASEYATIGLGFVCSTLAGKKLNQVASNSLNEVRNCKLNNAL